MVTEQKELSKKDATYAKATHPIRIPFELSEGNILLICGILCILIFLFDISVKIGFAISILYLIPAVICIWSPKRRTIFIVAGISSVLILIAIPLKPPGDFLIPLFNRPASLLALWVFTLLINQYIAIQKRSEEALKRSNDELQQFAYAASHDMQEPLRMVTNYLSLFERRNKDNLDPKSKEYIDFALEGGVRMRQLIDDLLSYSRVETMGKEFAPVDMQDVVTKTLTLFQLAIDESKAEIIVDPLPTVLADESQMVQLMQNLVGNAIKFHSQERPLIYISATKGQKEWTFTVKDNGIGLKMQYANKIFQVFQRLHSTSEYPGTGIGLAVAKKIVDRHEGRIWVESEEGKGAAFFFTIPI